MWFGYYKMFASIMCYQKKEPSVAIHAVHSKVEKQENCKKSYASMLKGNSKAAKDKERMVDVIEIASGDFIVEKKPSTSS